VVSTLYNNNNNSDTTAAEAQVEAKAVPTADKQPETKNEAKKEEEEGAQHADKQPETKNEAKKEEEGAQQEPVSNEVVAPESLQSPPPIIEKTESVEQESIADVPEAPAAITAVVPGAECSECHEQKEHVWQFKLVSLGETEARAICWSCANEIKSKIAARRDESAAAEGELELLEAVVASQASGGLACSECKQVCEPCEIWRFLFKSLGESEPRWVGSCCIQGLREKIRSSKRAAEAAEDMARIEHREERAVVAALHECSECHEQKEHVWQFKLVSLGETEARAICWSCANEIKSKIAARRDESAAAEGELELLEAVVASQASGGLACSECKQVCEPCEIWRFLFKSLGESEPRWVGSCCIQGLREKIRSSKRAAEAAEDMARIEHREERAVVAALHECSECHEQKEHVWQFKLVSLGETEARAICWSCANEIKSKIAARRDESAAAEGELELLEAVVASQASGGLACSECKQVCEPCEIWRFLFKSLGESEPRWVGSCCIQGLREKIRSSKRAAEAAEDMARIEHREERAVVAALHECSECHEQKEHVWQFKLVSLGETEARAICWSCANEIKSKIAARRDESAAAEGELELLEAVVASQASGGLACSECKQVCEPCEIWRFLFKSLGESEPRWVGSCCIQGLREKIRSSKRAAEAAEDMARIEHREERAVVAALHECSECHEQKEHVWQFKLVSLGETEARAICWSCANEIKSKIAARRDESAAAEGELELLEAVVASQASGGLACSECKQVCEPCEIWRFLFKSLGESEPRWVGSCCIQGLREKIRSSKRAAEAAEDMARIEHREERAVVAALHECSECHEQKEHVWQFKLVSLGETEARAICWSCANEIKSKIAARRDESAAAEGELELLEAVVASQASGGLACSECKQVCEPCEIWRFLFKSLGESEPRWVGSCCIQGLREKIRSSKRAAEAAEDMARIEHREERAVVAALHECSECHEQKEHVWQFKLVSLGETEARAICWSCANEIKSKIAARRDESAAAEGELELLEAVVASQASGGLACSECKQVCEPCEIWRFLFKSLGESEPRWVGSCCIQDCERRFAAASARQKRQRTWRGSSIERSERWWRRCTSVPSVTSRRSTCGSSSWCRWARQRRERFAGAARTRSRARLRRGETSRRRPRESWSCWRRWWRARRAEGWRAASASRCASRARFGGSCSSRSGRASRDGWAAAAFRDCERRFAAASARQKRQRTWRGSSIERSERWWRRCTSVPSVTSRRSTCGSSSWCRWARQRRERFAGAARTRSRARLRRDETSRRRPRESWSCWRRWWRARRAEGWRAASASRCASRARFGGSCSSRSGRASRDGWAAAAFRDCERRFAAASARQKRQRTWRGSSIERSERWWRRCTSVPSVTSRRSTCGSSSWCRWARQRRERFAGAARTRSRARLRRDETSRRRPRESWSCWRRWWRARRAEGWRAASASRCASRARFGGSCSSRSGRASRDGWAAAAFRDCERRFAAASARQKRQRTWRGSSIERSERWWRRCTSVPSVTSRRSTCGSSSWCRWARQRRERFAGAARTRSRARLRRDETSRRRPRESWSCWRRWWRARRAEGWRAASASRCASRARFGGSCSSRSGERAAMGGQLLHSGIAREDSQQQARGRSGRGHGADRASRGASGGGGAARVFRVSRAEGARVAVQAGVAGRDRGASDLLELRERDQEQDCGAARRVGGGRGRAGAAGGGGGEPGERRAGVQRVQAGVRAVRDLEVLVQVARGERAAMGGQLLHSGIAREDSQQQARGRSGRGHGADRASRGASGGGGAARVFRVSRAEGARVAVQAGVAGRDRGASDLLELRERDQEQDCGAARRVGGGRGRAGAAGGGGGEPGERRAGVQRVQAGVRAVRDLEVLVQVARGERAAMGGQLLHSGIAREDSQQQARGRSGRGHGADRASRGASGGGGAARVFRVSRAEGARVAVQAGVAGRDRGASDLLELRERDQEQDCGAARRVGGGRGRAGAAGGGGGEPGERRAGVQRVQAGVRAVRDLEVLVQVARGERAAMGGQLLHSGIAREDSQQQARGRSGRGHGADRASRGASGGGGAARVFRVSRAEGARVAVQAGVAGRDRGASDLLELRERDQEQDCGAARRVGGGRGRAGAAGGGGGEPGERRAGVQRVQADLSADVYLEIFAEKSR
jgi:Tfp pilus assembly protein PilX